VDCKAGTDDREVKEQVGEIATEVISFAVNKLQDSHPRDDYRELQELVIIFLDGVPRRGIHIIKTRCDASSQDLL
jgi:hypothetical protein